MNKLYNLVLVVVLLGLVGCRSEYKVTQSQSNSSSVTLSLEYTGSEEYYIKDSSPIIKRLTFSLHVYAFNDFCFKITDADSPRFEVPQQGVFPTDPLRNFSFPINLSGIRFEYSSSPFDFKILRKLNNATLFSTYDQDFLFSAHYMQIGTQVDTDYTYGLGERFTQAFKVKQGKWTIFNRDRAETMDHGTGLQTYGYYPFYLQRENGKLFHVNYFRSSNAMDVIKEVKDQKAYLTYKVIGGVFDFRFFLGQQSPELTLEKFQIYMGASAIPPFWSLGMHQCRWGYQNITYLQNVLESYENHSIPLDTIWSDIDYMVEYEDFTVDEEKFPLDQMKKITSRYHYIPIVDAGIKVNDGVAYKQGKERGVFVKDGTGKQELQGMVWPGTTTFVDFFHPNATKYWEDMLEILYQKVQFSGIWLDMNQYANFCDGPCETPSESGSFDYSKDLPYQPGADNIESHTIPLNSTHYGNVSEANVHAFAAFLETHATNTFLKSKGLRPFIITRSSTLGSNKYGFHWTGDNYASFEFLRSSITDNFNNQMWGFQMVGPDICGFGGNTTEELCARWYQLAAIYPFARSHNDYKSKSQEPYALGQTVLKSAQTNLKLRYSLLKHYYSMMVSRKGLGFIFKPLFFEFPQDSNNYVDAIADSHVLLGNELLAAPVLEEGQTSRTVYFSTHNWFDLHTGEMHAPGTKSIQGVGLSDPLPLFLREGSALLRQDTQSVLSSKDLGNTFELVAGLHLESQRSTPDKHLYNAVGTHMSISDYADEGKVEFCLVQGCQYVFTLQLTVTDTRSLHMGVSYVGGVLLNELLIIDRLSLFYDGVTARVELSDPIHIKGPMEVTIPIPNQATPHIRSHVVQQ